MAETRTYTGGCHCGAVRYQVTTKLDVAMVCNCSICSKSGTMMALVPDASQFQLQRGEDFLSDYQFGKKNVHHLFCRCGIRSFGRGTMPDGAQVLAVNVRCLDGVDLATVPLQQFDGKSLPVD